jgi:GAF domain-containing protein
MNLSKTVLTDTTQGPSADEAADLRRAVGELRLLNALAIALGTASDLQTMLGELVRHSLSAVGAEQGVIVLMEQESGARGHTLVRTHATSGTNDELRPGHLVLGWMQLHLKPLLLNAPASHPVFGDGSWLPSVRNLVAVPMLVAGHLLGVLTLFNKKGLPVFTDDDVRLLTILALQSALVIERARMAEEQAQAEAKRAEAESERDRLLLALGMHTTPAFVEVARQQGLSGLQARFDFTPQEARVALLLAERKTNQEVADALFVSSHTARHHTERVLKKLGIVSRRAVADALGLELP